MSDPAYHASQVIDPHTHKFMQRMQDEALFLALAQKVTKCMHTLQLQAIWCRSHLAVYTVTRSSHIFSLHHLGHRWPACSAAPGQRISNPGVVTASLGHPLVCSQCWSSLAHIHTRCQACINMANHWSGPIAAAGQRIPGAQGGPAGPAAHRAAPH